MATPAAFAGVSHRNPSVALLALRAVSITGVLGGVLAGAAGGVAVALATPPARQWTSRKIIGRPPSR
jgi:hypothetical protein